jgi:hypothetical protein
VAGNALLGKAVSNWLSSEPPITKAVGRAVGRGLAMKIHNVLRPYCNLMQDIKIRIDAMQKLAKNRSRVPDQVRIECEQLQIRMISETLAIACLFVHGDVEGTRSARLTKAYQADFIMNALEKLHPRFYPRPTKQILTNGVPTGIADVEDGFLTKSEMLKSYREAANFLHVGTLNDFLANETASNDYQAVGIWVRRLTTLLNHHCIYIADDPAYEAEPLRFSDGEPAPKFQIIVQMQTGPNDQPQATVFQSIGQV